MFGMPVFMAIRGGIRAPNGLRVTSMHLVACGITIAKNDALTQSRFFLEICTRVVPKDGPKSPLGAIWGTFGVLVPAFWRALGVLSQQ